MKHLPAAFRSIHAVTLLIFFSPAIVGLLTEVMEDYLCYMPYVLDPYLGLKHSLLAVPISCALVQLDKEGSAKLAGEDPPFGTQLFALIFLSIIINAILFIVAFVPYGIVRFFFGSPC